MKGAEGRHRCAAPRLWMSGACVFLLMYGVLAAGKDSASRDDTIQKQAQQAQRLRNMKTLLDSAKLLESNETWAAAEDAYRRLLSMSPRGELREAAFFGLGRVCTRLGKLWAAFDAIEKSYPPELDPVGVSQRAQMQYAIAMQCMTKGEATIPETGKPDSLWNGYRTAAHIFKAVAYNEPRLPETPWALVYRGDCLVRCGDMAGAAESYRLAMDRYPKADAGLAARAEVVCQMLAGAEVTTEAVQNAARVFSPLQGLSSIPAAVLARVTKAQAALREARAKVLLKKGAFYLRDRSARGRQAGVFVLKDLTRQYPNTEAAREAARLLQNLGGNQGMKAHE